MKREILFRGYSESLSKWVEGDLVHDAFDGTSMTMPIGIAPKKSYPIPVHPDSVGQFTGLCDMEGNRIFEGDIVKCDLATEPEDKGFICVFKDFRFKFVNARYPDDDFYTSVGYEYFSQKCKITGNTFKP
jgi:hypothetical protein